MHKWLILFSALGAMGVHAAPAWTWVDADGQVHFSDRPVPGARQVELSGAQGFSAPARDPRAPTAVAPPSSSTPDGPANAPPAYTLLEIVSPANQETLWNIGGTVAVQVSVQPGLRAGHQLDLLFDGQRRSLADGGLTLTGVFRGAHTLQAIIVDGEGRELLRSPSTTFYVQQTSTQNPNSPIARQRAASGPN